jgi:hypothetical protein
MTWQEFRANEDSLDIVPIFDRVWGGKRRNKGGMAFIIGRIEPQSGFKPCLLATPSC